VVPAVDSPPSALADDCIRVLICDDHALFRRGLMMVLEDEDDIEVIAEAANGVEAIDLARHLTPDVVLMDVRMPKVDGIAATRAILDSIPTAGVIMLTVSDEEEDLFDAMKAGAAGYLLKEISIDEVARSVRGVHQGQRLVTPSLATKLITEFAGLSRREPVRGLDAPQLTQRELEVLRHVADGASNREVAKRLGISENTVKNHVRNILEKLRLHSRMEAVLYAMREKLLDL
jgi:two-component system NarL family response regulator